MTEVCIYEEKLSSKRTGILFVTLALSFLLLFIWRTMAAGLGFLAIVFFLLFCFFSFYSLNYRRLIIHLAPEFLRLTFGIFRWTVPLATIEDCYLDGTSMWRIGGAGIHFTSIERRYRAMFNFLEYPRVVIKLKEKRGPVWDIAFSTGQPEWVMRSIKEAVSGYDTGTMFI
jgi:hypothetical protein